ncbi:MAG: hypothetical protein OSA06_02960 [Acidimicrobiales bacterium]|nr:hypothetical protein [Acidimicrobiales bacterium]
MLGAIIMIVLLVVVIPVGVLMSGALGAAVIGGKLKNTVDADHEGSELLAVSEANPYQGPAEG